MTSTPPGTPVTMRLAASLGPEVVASILVIVLAIVAVSVASSGRQAAIVAPTVAPTVAVVPSESASGAPNASAAPPVARAGALVTVIDRLLDQRRALEAELAKNDTDVVAIVNLLQAINQSLVLEEGPLAELAAHPTTLDLATRIRRINEAASDAVSRTQLASFRNEKAYRKGATEVVTHLGPLVELRTEVAIVAGLLPAPSPSPTPTPTPSPSPSPTVEPSQAEGTAEPSGTTP